MGLRLNLGRYLERREISAYRVVKETTGRLAPGTVYALARRPARRLDLETVSEVLQALGRITGEPVGVADLLETVDEARAAPEAGDRAALLAAARPLDTAGFAEADFWPEGEGPEALAETVDGWRREDRELTASRP